MKTKMRRIICIISLCIILLGVLFIFYFIGETHAYHEHEYPPTYNEHEYPPKLYLEKFGDLPNSAIIGYENAIIVKNFLKRENDTINCNVFTIWVQEYMFDNYYCMIRQLLEIYEGEYICIVSVGFLRMPFKGIIIIDVDWDEVLNVINCMHKKDDLGVFYESRIGMETKSLSDKFQYQKNRVYPSDIMRVVFGNRLDAMYLDVDCFHFHKVDVRKTSKFLVPYANGISNTYFYFYGTEFGRLVEKNMCHSYNRKQWKSTGYDLYSGIWRGLSRKSKQEIYLMQKKDNNCNLDVFVNDTFNAPIECKFAHIGFFRMENGYKNLRHKTIDNAFKERGYSEKTCLKGIDPMYYKLISEYYKVY